MSEPERESSGEETLDESGRNPTQRRLDAAPEQELAKPTDAPWGDENSDEP